MYCKLCLFIAGLFGFFKGDTADEVPKSVRRRMLVAQRAHANGDYARCERFYHQALGLLASSKHAGARAYLEARTVILDKVTFPPFLIHCACSTTTVFDGNCNVP